MTAELTLPKLFANHGLTFKDLQKCTELIQNRHPRSKIEACTAQGGCSYTLIVQSEGGEQFIVQFRLHHHTIGKTIARDVTEWYGNLTPTLLSLSNVIVGEGSTLQVYETSFVSGSRLSDLQSKTKRLDQLALQRYHILIESLADFFVMSWNEGIRRQKGHKRIGRDGRVGKSIQQRLQKLQKELPSSCLRAAARRARVQLSRLDCLPVVLTHGDLIPSNILVDLETYKITGLIDWAEAEYLPFGISLYVLDHLLGYIEQMSGSSGVGFVFYEQAGGLQRHFWTLLSKGIPELRTKPTLEAVMIAREVGILLWHGIAFDNGKIDRVVEPGKDDIELAYLNAFLDTSLRSNL